MKIDESRCAGCGNCVSVCTMGAISLRDRISRVEEDTCVECGTCRRFLLDKGRPPPLVRAVRRGLAGLRLRYNSPPDVCPTGAIYEPDLEWPRTVRKAFSDPTSSHEATGITGRGTEEVKTNDVTGRVGPEEAGVVVELGRPGIGASFRDVEIMAQALALAGVQFEPKNPVTALMADVRTGQMNPDILDERVMSAIIEMKCRLADLPLFLRIIADTGRLLPTVCSVAVSGRCSPDGQIPYLDLIPTGEFTRHPQAKTNLGLGRPGKERGAD